MNTPFFQLAANINSPLFVCTQEGVVTFANRFAHQHTKKALVGSLIGTLLHHENGQGLQIEEKVTITRWQGTIYKTMMTKWLESNVYYYQILLEPFHHIEQVGFFWLEELPIPLTVVNIENVFVYCNKKFRDLVTPNHESLIGKHLRYIIGQKRAEKSLHLNRMVLEKGTIHIEELERDNSGFSHYDYLLVKSPCSLVSQQQGVMTLYVETGHFKHRMRMVQEAEIRYQNLARSLLSTQDNERAALARELHDGLGQALIALKIYSYNASMQTNLSDMKATMMATLPLFDETIETVRTITSGLHPRLLRELGFKKAIDALIQQLTPQVNIQIELHVTENINEVSKEIEYACYRIAQEAFNNVIKHSLAKTVYIELSLEREFLQLIISDNGQGFNTNTPNTGERLSLGLLSMKERAKISGGELTMTSRIDVGTRINAVWRIPRHGGTYAENNDFNCR